MNDEIIEEVQAIKDAIAARFNYDLRAAFQEIKRGEAELQDRGIRVISPPVNPSGLPSTALQRTRLRHHDGRRPG
jgi:hypothetical protein